MYLKEISKSSQQKTTDQQIQNFSEDSLLEIEFSQLSFYSVKIIGWPNVFKYILRFRLITQKISGGIRPEIESS